MPALFLLLLPLPWKRSAVVCIMNEAGHRFQPRIIPVCTLRGAIAQLGERIVRNDEVVGSIPTSSTNLGGQSAVGCPASRHLHPRAFSLCVGKNRVSMP